MAFVKKTTTAAPLLSKINLEAEKHRAGQARDSEAAHNFIVASENAAKDAAVAGQHAAALEKAHKLLVDAGVAL